MATNYHVLNAKSDAKALAAMTYNGRLYPIVEILAGNQAADVALARVDVSAEPLTALPVRVARPGDSVSVISHPSRRFYSMSHGIVSRYSRQDAWQNGPKVPWMAITADFARGSSGAPVFDQAGNVCGIVSRTDSIYYDASEKGAPTNLQMVIKNCVPAQAIIDLME